MEAKASGKAAEGFISQNGTVRVRAPLTRTYPMVTIPMEMAVAIGILLHGSRASSPEVAIESNPTKA